MNTNMSYPGTSVQVVSPGTPFVNTQLYNPSTAINRTITGGGFGNGLVATNGGVVTNGSNGGVVTNGGYFGNTFASPVGTPTVLNSPSQPLYTSNGNMLTRSSVVNTSRVSSPTGVAENYPVTVLPRRTGSAVVTGNGLVTATNDRVNTSYANTPYQLNSGGNGSVRVTSTPARSSTLTSSPRSPINGGVVTNSGFVTSPITTSGVNLTRVNTPALPASGNMSSLGSYRSPTTRVISPTVRTVSPTTRVISPTVRTVSPTRVISPKTRVPTTVIPTRVATARVNTQLSRNDVDLEAVRSFISSCPEDTLCMLALHSISAPHPEQKRTVGDIIRQTSTLTTLRDLLEQYNLFDALDGQESVTVFAPTNTAFAKAIKAGVLNGLNEDQIKEVLLSHVVNGSWAADYLKSLRAGQLLKTAGKSFYVRNLEGVPHFYSSTTEAKVVNPDMKGFNGRVHEIDEVIL